MTGCIYRQQVAATKKPEWHPRVNAISSRVIAVIYDLETNASKLHKFMEFPSTDILDLFDSFIGSASTCSAFWN